MPDGLVVGMQRQHSRPRHPRLERHALVPVHACSNTVESGKTQILAHTRHAARRNPFVSLKGPEAYGDVPHCCSRSSALCALAAALSKSPLMR